LEGFDESLPAIFDTLLLFPGTSALALIAALATASLKRHFWQMQVRTKTMYEARWEKVVA
jgi:hypothetical protein